jgi:protein phosphatase
MKEEAQQRITVEHGSLVYRDDRMRGFDAAVCIEVIEHMELASLPKFAASVFGNARPKFVIVTTPNREYNVKYELGDRFRHNDHRFEWTRAEFRSWCEDVAGRYSYQVRFTDVGDFDEALGSPTQMATFQCASAAPAKGRAWGDINPLKAWRLFWGWAQALAIRQASDLPSPLETSGPPGSFPAPAAETEVLDIGPLLTLREFEPPLASKFVIRKAEAEAAIESLSRFGTDPRWLVYLPPTMSPPDRGAFTGLLEHPEQVFEHYRQRGLSTLVGQEKHMGSRAIVIVCRTEEAARKRFGVTDGTIGTCYTRTGRQFFPDADMQSEFVARVQQALSRANFWQQHATDWVILDCEIMPWSAKAEGLLTRQYAPVAVAGINALQSAIVDMEQLGQRGLDVQALVERHRLRLDAIEKYRDAYRRYCWPVQSLSDYRMAPFHILATEGRVYSGKSHDWHMTNLAQVAASSEDALLVPTPFRHIALSDSESCTAAVRWWTELTEAGGEGLVFKPFDFVSRHEDAVVQPAMKCRGREYLRIIYGPEYTIEGNLERLRVRDVRRKRKLALTEFALGIEALERFTRGEPLQQVHECIFGISALESEPLDPRL